MDTIQSTARQYVRQQDKQREESRQVVFSDVHRRAPREERSPLGEASQCEGQFVLSMDVAPARPPGAGVASQDMEEVEHWVRRWMIVYLGVFASRRPRQQLLRWCSPEVYQTVSRRQQLLAARERRLCAPGVAQPMAGLVTPVVKSVHLHHVGAGVYEAAVILRTGARFTAMALRVVVDRDHRGRRRARVTALEL
ncbi:Rv3235 family protein [Kineococcus radiotolerans]|uniref:Uncharacterized protein n=1 Tax=Kineococcus radiotolerans (strain ATCC BAA-149 / DSM 14245 / SRS30216) TaxID=266940 RepID=A6WH64_KINRD|nr:Rv3235 family protein [Kineococcus radiotolerans]ABS06153.1 hypothetical protein Krad_4695 [Kineococcus radiotolerans SRS30216 = ATCC BAA-149]